MQRLILVATLVSAMAASHWAWAQQATIIEGGALKWGAASPALPAGAQGAAVVGDPSKEGGYVARVKLPAGYKVAPHVHPNDENVTVLSGMFHLGIGDKFDQSKGKALKPGDFYQVPKGVQHFAWASQETVIQLHGTGPGGINYVNPADDPRKK